jgi:hypothetical protein
VILGLNNRSLGLSGDIRRLGIKEIGQLLSELWLLTSLTHIFFLARN